MNADVVQGKWKQLRGRAKKWWGSVTNDPMAVFDGEQAEINGSIQERAGRLRSYNKRAVRAIESWRL